ncbi:MAG: hypothetical protein ACLPR9_00995 [Acidimicrobiales bacterium]|jgi:hypothetical protein
MVVPIHSETGDSLADQDLPGANPAIPSIHLGIDASSSDLGRPRNFHTAATCRATLSTSFRIAAPFDGPEPGDRLTAPVLA